MKFLSPVSTILPRILLTKAVVGFISLVCLSLILATAWQMRQSRSERFANAEMTVYNIVRAAEQHAQDTVKQADNTLRDLVERIENDGVSSNDQKARLKKLMAQNVVNIEGIQGIFIYNEQGNWVANSFPEDTKTRNNSDRAYFIYHRDHADESLHIGSIVKSRTTGDMIIPISRRINAADGNFAGVALATIPVTYFQNFFERLDVDNKGVIFLALNNGDLLARRPTLTKLQTTNVSKGEIFSIYLPRNDSGTAVVKSIVDGVERVYAYRRLSRLPIVAAAGVSFEHVFAPWWTYAYRSIAMISIIVLALAFLGILLYRQIQQLVVAEGELIDAKNELDVIAHTDSLTRLANRRCFDQNLHKEWGRAGRSQSDIALILLDIDWFKQFNDHYGHLQGDKCLKQIADLMELNVKRPIDLPARFGGEEFVILLPETNLEGALYVAEKIRSAVINAHIEHSGSPIRKVTISVGVVAVNAPEKDGYTAALAEADRLLYCAKNKGRNRVEGRFLHNCFAAREFNQSQSKQTEV
ncbi:sensor domain-containing diguanylate cyclase [Pseudomonas prosekii]|uniref:diguanylate cyclase n=1 Tax=Pseudomonas prosekii TaxID=1148509 RepID=A0A2U2D3M9_9PSED|nr:diguanylate cyclase [Pseudomonas prosekii]PWE41408.1 diguanylate cyclase [Pseudomonas prosekii]